MNHWLRAAWPMLCFLALGSAGCSNSDADTVSGLDGGSSGGSPGIGVSSAGTSNGASGGVPNGMPGQIGGCTMFPAADDWNRDISGDPVDATWTTKLQTMVGNIKLHPDYGAG